MNGFVPPVGYTRIKLVKGFAELATTPFTAGINALCWPRRMPNGFPELFSSLDGGEGIVAIEEAQLRRLPISAAGRAAVDVVLEDLRLLGAMGREPILNFIHDYPRDPGGSPVRTDVFSFHADSAPVEADTWLCTYHGNASEGLRNDEAQRRVDIPEVRAALLDCFGGKDDEEEFREYLSEQCYDLHYAPLPAARPFSFGIGNLWRIAVDWPGSAVPPCFHRAPETQPGQPRLLLIC